MPMPAPDNTKQTDVRVRKTKAALIDSIILLLNKKRFDNITVNELCEHALVSRAAFYTHFNDRYELLRYLLVWLLKDVPADFSGYSDNEMITIINNAVAAHKKIIKNLVEYADEQTLDMLQEFTESLLSRLITHETLEQSRENDMLRFCAGGITSLLKWQVRNRFPLDKQFISEHIYKMLKSCSDES